MERYEFKGDGSNKFWEVEVVGEKLRVRFGRIGADGQTKEKSFASAAAASKEKDALVKEKTAKGYVAAAAGVNPARREPAMPEKPPAAVETRPAQQETRAEAPPAAKSAPPPAGASFLLRPALASRSRPAPVRHAEACLTAIAEALAAPRPLNQRGEAIQPWPEALLATPLRADMSANEIASWGALLVQNAQLSWIRSSREPHTAAIRGLFENFAFWCVA